MRQVKSLVKQLVSPAVDALGVYDRRLRGASQAVDRWTIVMYHRVIADMAADPFRLGMCVERKRFEAQIRFLHSRFNIIPIAEGIRHMRCFQPLPAGALSVTFDDGYLDNLENAAPVLESLGIPWTLFVVTGDLDVGRMLWWDRVIAAFGGTAKRTVGTTDLGLPGDATALPLDLGRAAGSVESVLERLWSLEHDLRMTVVQRIEEVLTPRMNEMLMARRLSAEQVVQLHRRGVEIGAHSVQHPNLGICDEANVSREMRQCRQDLEQLLQAPVPGFAYPGGRLNDATLSIARHSGFEYALATDVGVNTSSSDPFRLMRIGMPNSELADFRRAISGAMMRDDGMRSLMT